MIKHDNRIASLASSTELLALPAIHASDINNETNRTKPKKPCSCPDCIIELPYRCTSSIFSHIGLGIGFDFPSSLSLLSDPFILYFADEFFEVILILLLSSSSIFGIIVAGISFNGIY
jgi:hypothetical protein